MTEGKNGSPAHHTLLHTVAITYSFIRSKSK